MVCYRASILVVIITALVVIGNADFSVAKDIKNHGDCDVCPGALHYGPKEASGIIGDNGRILLSQIGKELKHVKIDLDGVLKNGSEKSVDKGYELHIYGKSEYLIIKSLKDKSFIQIITDYQRAHKDAKISNWSPEIYLHPDPDNKIDLEDSMEIAKIKLSDSEIHRWIQGNQKGEFEELLGKRIMLSLLMFHDRLKIHNNKAGK